MDKEISQESESALEPELSQEQAEVSLMDRNKIQVELAKKASMELMEWIEQDGKVNSKILGDIIDEMPELVSGFADLPEGGDMAQEMLDDIEDELKKRKQTRKAA